MSDIEDVRGTDPVRRTVSIPRVSSVKPSDREKYSSRARRCQNVILWLYRTRHIYLLVASRYSGESIVIMIVGDMINGRDCNVSHPAVPYV